MRIPSSPTTQADARKIFRVLLLLPLLLLLVGCTAPAGLSPETAALSFLLDERLGLADSIHPFSIQILHKQDFLGQVLLLATFQRGGAPGEREDCMMVFNARQGANSAWSAIGQGTCQPYPSKEPRPQIVEAGQAFLVEPGGPRFYSLVYGRLWQQDVCRLAVTWEDGHVQQAELMKGGVYLAARDGEFAHRLIEGHTQDGELVYSQSNLNLE